MAVEHLGHQVLPDRSIGARELGHKALGIRVTAERDHRQAHSGRPAFRAPVQRGSTGARQADSGRRKQLDGFALGEAKVAGPDVGNLVREPELVKSERGIPARRQHDACGARQIGDQTLEVPEGVR